MEWLNEHMAGIFNENEVYAFFKALGPKGLSS